MWREEYETLDDAGRGIGRYVDRYHDRPHSSLDYRTPREVPPDPDAVSLPKFAYPPMSSSSVPHTLACPHSRPLDWRLWSAQQ